MIPEARQLHEDFLLLHAEMTLLSIRAGKAMRTMQEALDCMASLQERIDEAGRKIGASRDAHERAEKRKACA